jgi:putative hydroxymethylpyrimidine transport system permease protein
VNLFLRGIIVTLGIFILWQCVVVIFDLPPYILPTPINVIKTGYQNFHLISQAAVTTMTETLLGLVLGALLGCIAALLMAVFRPLSYWLLPILIISQAIPTFAVAPLLVIWFGYGMASKIITTIIMLFFPVTSAFYDGLRSNDQDWRELAITMNAKRWRYFWNIRIPAALPNLASGLRVATVIAPIGAIIGEWVGASSGLGYLMLNANARMQIDFMFAGLFALVLFSLSLYFTVDTLLHRLVPWQKPHS